MLIGRGSPGRLIFAVVLAVAIIVYSRACPDDEGTPDDTSMVALPKLIALG